MGLDKNVGIYMNRDIVIASPNETLAALVKRMTQMKSDYAVVIDEGEIVGLIDSNDIINVVKNYVISKISYNKIPTNFREMLISELLDNPRLNTIMDPCGERGIRPIISIGKDNTIEEAITLLAAQGCNEVLVMGDKEPEGVLTTLNLLAAIADSTYH
jgi:CBS domain-containing protein